MMHFRSTWSAVVGYIWANRKCFPLNGSLIFVLAIMLCTAQQAAARPSQDDGFSSQTIVSDELLDIDNLEAHNVKVLSILPEEEHPIIIYKEDLMNEDYVPPKSENKGDKHKRRHKVIFHRHRKDRQNLTDVVLEANTEKIFFDILPEKPLIVPEDMERYANSHKKLVPVTVEDDFSDFNETENEEAPRKGSFPKKPKKFQSRVRRSVDGQHIVRKRNPYFRQVPKTDGEVVPTQVQYIYVKHAVPGKKHNGLDTPVPDPQANANDETPISFGNRIAADENDRVIFPNVKTTSRPKQRATESIFRDPRPQNFDFNFMNTARRTTTSRVPTPTRRPEITRQEESIFRDPRPENFDFTFMNPQQQQSSLAIAKVPPPVATSQTVTQSGVSQCVWAIVNCCSSRSSEIRYACFEQNGCYGAFWGLNPCAENVRDGLVSFVADYYN